MRFLVIFFSLLSGPAAALDFCDELWFTRNLHFDRAGYCFGSALGQAVFDNSDCDTQSPALSSEAAKDVAYVRELETVFQCRVDTSRARLDIPDIIGRKAIVDIPIPSEGASGCIGWTGERVLLRTARDPAANVTAAIRPGDTLIFEHEDVDGWSFILVQQNNIDAGFGWAQVQIGEAVCEGLAG